MNNQIFICLPVTKENFKDQQNHAFNLAVDLGLKGMEAISPFDINNITANTPLHWLGNNINQIVKVGAIFVCRDWQKYPECVAMVQTAIAFNKRIIME